MKRVGDSEYARDKEEVNYIDAVIYVANCAHDAILSKFAEKGTKL